MEITTSEAKDWFRYGIDETRRQEILNELGLLAPDWYKILDSFYYEIKAYANM